MINTILPPIPFTVIGGFLGSGKTTLLNYLLSQNSNTRYAVLVNDFGFKVTYKNEGECHND